MELRSELKILLLALTFCVFLSVVFSDFLIASHDHDVAGEENGCPVCLLIGKVKLILGFFKKTVVLIFLPVFILFPYQKKMGLNISILSSIILKVRFNT